MPWFSGIYMAKTESWILREQLVGCQLLPIQDHRPRQHSHLLHLLLTLQWNVSLPLPNSVLAPSLKLTSPWRCQSGYFGGEPLQISIWDQQIYLFDYSLNHSIVASPSGLRRLTWGVVTNRGENVWRMKLSWLVSVLTGSEFLVIEQLKSHHPQSANVWMTHIPQVVVGFHLEMSRRNVFLADY